MTSLCNRVIIDQRSFSEGEFSSPCGLYMLIPMQIKNPLTHPILIVAYFVQLFGASITVMVWKNDVSHPCYDKR